MSDKTWTNERVAVLRLMWREGKTVGEIATVIGPDVSRNAVIGKAHRLRLSARPSPIKGEQMTQDNSPLGDMAGIPSQDKKRDTMAESIAAQIQDGGTGPDWDR